MGRRKAKKRKQIDAPKVGRGFSRSDVTRVEFARRTEPRHSGTRRPMLLVDEGRCSPSVERAGFDAGSRAVCRLLERGTRSGWLAGAAHREASARSFARTGQARLS